MSFILDIQNTPPPTLPVTTPRITTRAPVTTQRPTTTRAPFSTSTADPFAESFGATSGAESLWAWSTSGIYMLSFTSIAVLLNFAVLFL